MRAADDLGYFHGYVGACLADGEADRRMPVVDGDGDYVIGWAGSPVYVSVVDGPVPMVKVWASAAHGLAPRAALLREINELGAGLALSKVLLHRWGAVTVSVQLPGAAVNAESLAHAVTAVGTDAERVGVLLATVHGGQGAFGAAPAGAGTDAESA